jgi:excisionase family DNA binding protein
MGCGLKRRWVIPTSRQTGGFFTEGETEMPREIMGIKYYTVKETSKMLGKTQSTIYSWIYNGYVNYSQPGTGYLIPESEIIRVMKPIKPKK